MYKVLIVEDEMLVRMGIKASVNWEKFGMSVIGDVSNGQIAWEIYEKEHPSLILTDIVMPVMDGLELISKIREKDCNTQIVILSCKQEFSYVQKALKFGVTDYIAKLTMTQDEIHSVLEKVKNKLDEINKNTSIENSNILMNNGKYFQELLQKTLHNYLVYHIYSQADFNSIVGMKLNSEKLVLCVLDIEDFNICKNKFKDERGDLIRFSILNILNEILESFQIGIVIADTDKRYLLFFSFHDKPDTDNAEDCFSLIFKILEQIKRTINTYLSIDVSSILSGLFNGYDKLIEMYDKCIEAMQYKFILNPGLIIRLEFINKTELQNIKQKKLKLLIDNNKDLSPSIITVIQELIISNDLSKESIQNIFIRIVANIIKSIPSFNFNTNYNEIITLNNKIVACDSLDNTIDLFQEFLSDIYKINIPEKNYSREVNKVINYIKIHFSEKITVDQIADLINYSPNYLCTIFKKETETNLTEYINNIRIENSKKLLKSTNLRNFEIAIKVGFMNESYFANLFKKYTGMTPNEFKSYNATNSTIS